MATELRLIKSNLPEKFANMNLISTKLVMPEHLNPGGTLFGGQMMSWMDLVSAMLAQRITKGHVVTASVSEINFKAPGLCGDQIELQASLEDIGKSSLKIFVEAFRVKNGTDGIEAEEIANSSFTFVHMHEGKPAYIER